MDLLKSAGYSGTPLAKKLGIKPDYSIKLVNAPLYYLELFTDFPIDVRFEDNDSVQKNFIHFFTKQEDELVSLLPLLKSRSYQMV